MAKQPKQAFPRRVQGQTTQTFKEGDYVPLVILIFKDGNPHNIHLPQKLFAVKEFKQLDALTAYQWEHPQQPVMLNEAQPNIGLFNAAVCCFHNWLIEKGYCRSEGKADLTKIYLWTPEEIAAAKAEEAQKAALNATLAATEGTVLTEDGNPESAPHVNVGTVGHIDHGKSGLGVAMERATDSVKLDPPQYPAAMEPAVDQASL